MVSATATLPFKHFILLLNIKLQKIHWDFGASFLAIAATFDHSLGILESNLKGGGQKSFHSSTRLSEVRNHPKTTDSDGHLYFSAKTENFHLI
jgi:hypothetical protein